MKFAPAVFASAMLVATPVFAGSPFPTTTTPQSAASPTISMSKEAFDEMMNLKAQAVYWQMTAQKAQVDLAAAQKKAEPAAPKPAPQMTPAPHPESHPKK